MDVSVGAKTDAGKRANNEDAVLVLQPRKGGMGADAVIIVADGMGGRASGEDASSTAVKTIRATLDQLLEAGPSRPPYADALATAIRRANSDVFELARERPGQKGMGTTIVAAIIADDSAVIAHVGDSRAYLLRDGLLRRLTEDHSYIHDQIKSGNLSDFDARNSRFRHVITKAIGIDPTVQPDIRTHKLQVGDSLLICTDGLSNIVDEAGMIQIMSRARTAQEAIDYLVDAAKRGGSKDNITGALARIGVFDPNSGSGASSGEIAHGSIVPEEAIAIIEPEPLPLPVRARVCLSAEAIRTIASVAIGLVAGVLLTALLCLAMGWLRFSKVQAPPPKVEVVQPRVNVESLTYAQPRILMDKDVLSNLMAGNPAGVIVVDAKTRKLLQVNQAGQVRSTDRIDAGTISEYSTLSMATDDQGYIYIANSETRLLKRYSPDGRFEQTIGQGHLDKPQALFVTHVGDIYIVDNNRLKLIRACH